MSKKEKLWLFLFAFSMLSIYSLEIPFFRICGIVLAIVSGINFVLEEGKR